MPYQGTLARSWRYIAAIALVMLLAVELAPAAAATIEPGTPSADSTPPPEQTPTGDTGEIAPEPPPADLPTISQEGYSFDLTATLRTDLDSIPKQSPIYTVTREVTTKEGAQRLADNLGIGAQLVEQGTNSWSADGKGSLFVSPDFVQYISQEPAGDGDLPTDQDAIAFAQDWLRTTGMLPANIGNGSVTERSDDAMRMVVQFGVQEPGTVMGDFPGVSVTLGPNGIVLEATKRWANVQRSDIYQLRDSGDAWSQVLSNQGYIEADIDEADLPPGSTVKGTVTYNNVSIAYTTAGPPGGDQYLVPIFVFRGRVRLEGSDKTYAIRTYVPALANSGAPVG